MNVKEVGMQFQQWEVKALLDGRKTRLTKIVKPQPPKSIDYFGRKLDVAVKAKQPCQVGDVIWVRETWSYREYSRQNYGEPEGYLYKVDCNKEAEKDRLEGIKDGYDIWKWKPSIHMPREAARLFLKVKSVKVQRLQDITEEEAQQEGLTAYFEQCCSGKDIVSEYELSAKEQFLDQFKNHEDNPWVWVIEFEILQDYKKEGLKCQKQ